MEPLFNVGDRVLLITKNGTKERTQVTNVFPVDGGFVYQVKSRKNPVPEDRLEPVSDPYGNHLIEFTPDDGIGPVEFTPDDGMTNDMKFDLELGLVMMYETGDVVEVKGYPGRRFIVDSFTVVMSGQTNTTEPPDFYVEWLVLDEKNPKDFTRSIIADEEDMRKVGGGGRKMMNLFGAPIDDDDHLGHSILKKPDEKKGRTEEKRRLAQVEKYREMHARADRMVTDNMTLYGAFGDEKYKRKADRLKAFRDRIPTRGYQFE